MRWCPSLMMTGWLVLKRWDGSPPASLQFAPLFFLRTFSSIRFPFTTAYGAFRGSPWGLLLNVFRSTPRIENTAEIGSSARTQDQCTGLQPRQT